MEKKLPDHAKDKLQEALVVDSAESGMKLLRFLERRLEQDAGKSLLHKWIRTGQVRVNGGRVGPFLELSAGDLVRVPPFATVRDITRTSGQGGNGHCDTGPALAHKQAGVFSGTHPADAASCQVPTLELGADLPVIDLTGDYIVLAKPPGLPTQPGSGEDSVVRRLRGAFACQAFVPAPAHRLDKNTSGLVLAGRNHLAQRRLHELFKQNRVRKHYLAWVSAPWPHKELSLLEDSLEKRRDSAGREKMVASENGACLPLVSERARALISGSNKALSVVLPVQYLEATDLPPGLSGNLPGAALMLVLLLTGRTHQIRVQFASRGFPLIGDGRYDGPRFSHMLLHCLSLGLPPGSAGQCLEWSLYPDWPDPFKPGKAALAGAIKAMTGRTAFLHQCASSF